MKWKDSAEISNEEEQSKEEFFDEEQYSPWTKRKDPNRIRRLNKVSALLILLTLAIVALVIALLTLIVGRGNDTTALQSTTALEQRVQRLEERLDQFEAIDEKVTRIWEQAKAFEKFKDRFDRTEASVSLRMDHLTMSLETLQKQFSQSRTTAHTPSTDADKEKPISTKPAETTTGIKYHEVAPGETLYSISKKYKITVEELLKMNNMNGDSVIKVNQKLIVGMPNDK